MPLSTTPLARPLPTTDLLSYIFAKPSYPSTRPIFIDPLQPDTHFLTYASSRHLVRLLIAGFKAQGLQRGDVVCVHSFNTIYYACIVLAVAGAGGVAVGTNPGYTPYELQHAFKLAHVKWVITEKELVEGPVQALGGDDAAQKRVFVLEQLNTSSLGDDEGGVQQNLVSTITNTIVGSILPGPRSWTTLLTHGIADWICFDDAEKSRTTTAQYYFTSGTSGGLPKCAKISHANLIAANELLYVAEYNDAQVSGTQSVDTLVYAMPFFHMGVGPYIIVSPLSLGRQIYVMRRFELHSYLTYQSRFQATELGLVPPMVVAIVMSGLADPASPNYDPACSLRSVQKAAIGAAPLSADLQGRLNRLLAEGAACRQVWGMTETTAVVTVCSLETRAEASWGHVGVPLAGCTVKLADEVGRDVTYSKRRGECCVKGPIIFQGYLDDEKATGATFDEEGYFKTGDVFELREDGMLQVVDRVKELIKVRGFQVAPAELEGVLTEHVEIADAAVIGLRGGDGDEQPKAFIVKQKGSKLVVEDVQEYIRPRLARYKQLTGGVEFVDALPKSPAGKILKRVLREQEERKRLSNASKL